jgi:outer membrane protein insertion porin family
MKKRFRLHMLLAFAFPALGFLSAFSPHANAAPLDEVQITGVPAATADQIETLRTLSGFLPGDEIEKPRVERATMKLKDYFESKGYPQAVVTSEVSMVYQELPDPGQKRVLFFKVELGPPVKIMGVDYTLQTGKLSTTLLNRITRAVDFRPGELYDRDRVKEMRRLVESALNSSSFVDSRVNDVKTVGIPNGVNLEFALELGQRVVFSVYGNEYFARSELMSLIEEQRTAGLSKDYVNVILTRLHDHYVEHGFRNVVITPYTFESRTGEPRKVVYQITENPKVMIHQLVFDGNEYFTQGQLEEIFYSHAPDRVQARIYNEKMVEDSARSMIEELKNRGFLSAKIIAIKTDELDEKGNVTIKVFLKEGLQTHVQAIDFRNNHLISNDKLIEYLGLKEGSPLSLVQLETGIERIKREYRNLGYLNMTISNETSNSIVSYSEKNQYAYLNFDISEGNEIRVLGIEIFGNEVTHRSVLQNEIRLKPGEPIAENKVLETEARLRRLGIFSQVNIELIDVPGQPDYRTLKLTVQEGTPGNTSAGIGFRNDLGVRVFGQVGYNNLWGMGHSWVLDTAVNRRLQNFRFTEYNAQITYIWPYFVFGETTFRPSISVEKREFYTFDAETYALSAGLERSLYRPWKLTGSLTYTLEDVREFDNTVDTTQNQRVRLGSITPLLRVDLRDNSLIPRKGFFGLTSYEFADRYLGTQVVPAPLSYGRFQARADYYFDFIPHINWYVSARGGWLRNFSDTHNADGSLNVNSAVPLIKYFALGGISSIRGYNDLEIQVPAGVLVYNSMTYMNYRTQFDYLAGPNLTVGPFLDAGNLNVDSYSLGNLLYGTGVALRYLTPVGPINFDWGFKLFPPPGSSTNVFYFSLGVI